MSFNPLSLSAAASASAPSPSDDPLLRSLMTRLNLNSNSFLSHPLHHLLQNFENLENSETDPESPPPSGSDPKSRRRLIAKEESKLEKEIIRIVLAGDAADKLKANSGQSVAIGEHNICVGVHDDPGSEYRVWEWHGHIMFFDDEDGYSAEYIYGNYFEKLSAKEREAKKKEMKEKKEIVVDDAEEDDDEVEEEKSKVNEGWSSGLKDLIEELEGSAAGSEGSRRVIRRNSMR